MVTKNKNINITPFTRIAATGPSGAKGISIVIKNDFQPEVKPKRKRKYKKKLIEKLNPQSYPSYIPPSSGGLDVSYIKPQYNMSSLNRNMFFPGTPQSLPPPPQLPQIAPPPQLPQIMPPPMNISFDNMFGSMMDSMMPREYGFKSQSYVVDVLDEDIMDALPPAEKDKYIEKKMLPQIQQEIKDISFPTEDKRQEAISKAISTKTAKEWGTKHANKLIPYDPKYAGNEYYKTNYVARLQEIISQDAIKTRGGTKENTAENKNKARELLKQLGVDSKPALSVAVPTYAPPATPPRERTAIFSPPVSKEKPIEKSIEKPIALPPAASAAKAGPPPPPPSPAAAKELTPPPPAKSGPPPPPPPAPPPAAAKSGKVTADEKTFAPDAVPLSKEMKAVLKTKPDSPIVVAGWSVGLIENDDVLDYLQEVIDKISEDEEFMKDLKKSRGSGKLKFYGKYYNISEPFEYNNVSKIKQKAWQMFLESNPDLEKDFKDETEPVKKVKKVDAERLNTLSERAKSNAKGAKIDEENRIEEEKKKKKEMEEARKKQDEENRKAEEEKARKAEERRNKKKEKNK